MEAAIEGCSRIKTVPESFKSFKNVKTFVGIFYSILRRSIEL